MHALIKKPASSFHKIKPVSSKVTVEKEAPRGNQETDDLKPVFPNNDCTVKHSYKATGRIQKSRGVSHVYKFYEIVYSII